MRAAGGAAGGAVALLLAFTPAARSDTPVVLVQSTTSTQNSGLYDAILPLAEAALGLEIRVVAVGTGQALQNAARCDGDVLIVHDRMAEIAFVAAGHGRIRHDLMANDFVLIGPAEDPAGVGGRADITAALSAIAQARAPFVSRGDDSGTHRAERALWDGITDIDAASGTWYRETGSGMGASLNVAQGMGAYVLSDRATWAAFANRGALRLLHEGDRVLHNPYGVIPVSPDHCPNVNATGAEALADWLISDAGQSAIAGFRINGEQVFFPARRPAE